LILSIAKLQKAPLQVIPSGASAYEISPAHPAHDSNEAEAEAQAETELEIPLRENTDFMLRSATGVNPLFELKSLRFR
jgi:hypothetical protein